MDKLPSFRRPLLSNKEQSARYSIMRCSSNESSEEASSPKSEKIRSHGLMRGLFKNRSILQRTASPLCKRSSKNSICRMEHRLEKRAEILDKRPSDEVPATIVKDLPHKHHASIEKSNNIMRDVSAAFRISSTDNSRSDLVGSVWTIPSSNGTAGQRGFQKPAFSVSQVSGAVWASSYPCPPPATGVGRTVIPPKQKSWNVHTSASAFTPRHTKIYHHRDCCSSSHDTSSMDEESFVSSRCESFANASFYSKNSRQSNGTAATMVTRVTSLVIPTGDDEDESYSTTRRVAGPGRNRSRSINGGPSSPFHFGEIEVTSPSTKRSITPLTCPGDATELHFEFQNLSIEDEATSSTSPKSEIGLNSFLPHLEVPSPEILIQIAPETSIPFWNRDKICVILKQNHPEEKCPRSGSEILCLGCQARVFTLPNVSHIFCPECESIIRNEEEQPSFCRDNPASAGSRLDCIAQGFSQQEWAQLQQVVASSR